MLSFVEYLFGWRLIEYWNAVFSFAPSLQTTVVCDSLVASSDVYFNWSGSKTQSVYVLTLLERYALYALIRSSLITISFVFNFNGNVIDILGHLVILPSVQNYISNKIQRLEYTKDVALFTRYYISLNIIRLIKSLDNNIKPIPNYAIFRITSLASYKGCLKVYYTFLYIGFIQILKECETTYLYYKAVKYAYYYKFGYMFNSMSKDTAIDVINAIIDGNRWEHLASLDVMNAVVTMSKHKFKSNFTKSDLYNYMEMFGLLWSLLLFYSILNNALQIYIMFILASVSVSLGSIDMISCALILPGVLIGLPSILVTFILVCRLAMVDILKEAHFYIKNRKDMRITILNVSERVQNG
uniref:Uncharacterized protein n=1 Tax=viral metagenome TaxID=1070528 RepID=A0A6C0DZK2_9ZZZZ